MMVGFPWERASNAERVSISLHHHDTRQTWRCLNGVAKHQYEIEMQHFVNQNSTLKCKELNHRQSAAETSERWHFTI